MDILTPDDPAARRIDDALASWRQGDVALGVDWFGHVADGAAPLTAAATEVGDGPRFVQTQAEGVVVLTQTCDLVRNCLKRPFVDIAPLVEVDEADLRQIERGYLPNYAIVPHLRSQRRVAFLDRVLTVEKSVVANWTRSTGFSTDEEARTFARALIRKHTRFAFPDAFNDLVRKLQGRIKDKHDKQTEEGRALRALREIRVSATPNWDADRVEVFFWFVRHDDDVLFEGKGWDKMLTAWMALVTETARFRTLEGLVVALRDMTAEEYVDSSPLDLDHLSSRND